MQPSSLPIYLKDIREIYRDIYLNITANYVSIHIALEYHRNQSKQENCTQKKKKPK